MLSLSHSGRRTGLAACALASALTLAAGAPAARAQHEHHKPQEPAKSTRPQPPPQPSPAQRETQPAPTPQTQPTHDEHVAPAPPQPAASPRGAQPHEHNAPAPQPAPPAESAAPAGEHVRMDHSAHGAMMAADTSGLLGMSGNLLGIRVGASETNIIPMGQMGSGTAWQPASTPTPMWHRSAGEWLLMFHGEVKLGVNRQGGPRGVTKFESQNWFMPMALRKVGRGTLQLRGMLSLEPLTFSGAGSPQLFQTGEVYKGQPIRDFQHPHDLFMELSATYTVPVGERANVFAYLAYPGEPALGPVAFMHRPSASENPTAPLGHHLQDSTHISFGVATAGFTYRWLKLEGSLFNGREPDDRRYNFEANPWNSRSLRVSVAPSRNWTMQYSYGLLRNPEFFTPGDTRRQTASVQHSRPLARGNWATSFIWGRNREGHDGETFRLNSYLLESTVNFLDKNYLYTRLELADREGEDLLSHDELHDAGFPEGAHPQFRIGAYTFGGARDLWNTERLSTAIGADLTLYTKPEVLDAVYGRHPTSFKIFLRIRPGKMSH